MYSPRRSTPPYGGILSCGRVDRCDHTLTGYGNPGGVGGYYLRYAPIYKFDQLFCVTNLANVTLQ